MEASAVAQASRRGLLARRSPLLRLQKDERLIALVRDGHDHAFEAIVERYHSRLLAFCRGMLKSHQDAEDVLQEVYVSAHKAIRADNRHINVRPWLYRIARNRCLNHLRKQVPEGRETMDDQLHANGRTTHEVAERRERMRDLFGDIADLPETQRTALVLREMEALSYSEIAETMDTTVAAVKSLLVRARMSLAEAGEARLLDCSDVRLELAEAAEGLGKVTGAGRRHVRECERCAEFRRQLKADDKSFAVLAPAPALLLAAKGLVGKLGFGPAAAEASTGLAGAIGAGTASAAGAGGFSVLSSAAASKAVAGVASAALLTVGTVEVKHRLGERQPANQTPAAAEVRGAPSAPTSPASAPPVKPTAGVPAPAAAAPLAAGGGSTPSGAPAAAAEYEESPAKPAAAEADAGKEPGKTAAGSGTLEPDPADGKPTEPAEPLEPAPAQPEPAEPPASGAEPAAEGGGAQPTKPVQPSKKKPVTRG